MNIAIIGAGPAGLAAALRLHQQGFAPVIYEKVREIKPLGVGLDIKVYGVKELEELGLLAEFEAISNEAVDSIFYSNHGQEIYAEKCGTHMGYQHQQRFVHRGYLQMLLYRTVLERLGPDAIQLGIGLERYENTAEGVRLHLETREGEKVVKDVDVLLGADGIKSVVRAQMHPTESSPKFSGIRMYRGVTVMDPYRDGHTILHIGAPRIASMIVYPLHLDYEGTGKTLVNWVVETEGEEMYEDWNTPGEVNDLIPLFDDTKLPFLDVQQMLRDAKEVYVYPLVDHDPLDRWVDGRVVLIGDAAHAMYPRGGNGACQSIVDGRVIAEKLAAHPENPERALQEFEAERLERVNRLVLANRGEAYEVIRRLVQDRTDAQPFDDIEQVLPMAEADAIFSKYHALAGQPRPGFEDGHTTGFRTWEAEDSWENQHAVR
ncbi:FAD-dependent monooxygenase [Gulosibacter chungangensis]|uniref:NAD(P)-binding protein n=1 Tax=Gulosibacter chungangensis TaxID=979746 RepID=A0A7J5B7X3_9MICO|nr:FAD-dependent monooxygenase [Gulosibacter chungangensis]KAB1641223.1 NAD(P)-binding protein [Gulosibacter chungangensis]